MIESTENNRHTTTPAATFVSTKYEDCLVTLGDYSWIVLKSMGDKYFVLAEQPIFKGYYSLEPCDFNDSKLHRFLDNKFIDQLVNGGVDVSKVSGLSILSLVQYERYVKNKAPRPITPFLLLTPHPDEPHCLCGINTDGELLCLSVKEPCGIRPCMYVDKEYLLSVTGEEIHELEEVEVAKPKVDIVPPVAEDITPKDEIAEEHTDLSDNEEELAEANSEVPELGPDEVERLIRIEETAELPEDGLVLDEHNTETKEPEVEEASETSATDSEPDGSEEAEEIDSSNTTTEVDTADDMDAAEEIAEAQNTLLAEESISEASGTEEGAVIERETETISSVYVFEGQYKDFAVYLDENSERSKDVLERYGLAIRAYLASGDRGGRVPIDRDKAMKRIKTIQSRWRWSKS